MKKIALMMLLPMLVLFAIPVIPVHANSWNVEITVYCDTTNASSATLTYSGHTVTTACHGSPGLDSWAFRASRPLRYTVMVVAEGITFTQSGTYKPGSGAISGFQSPPSGEGIVGWCLSDIYGDGCFGP